MQGQKLQELLKSSDFISQTLDYLKTKLKRGQESVNDIGQDAQEYIHKAIELKMAFRILADGIQTNRSLVQIQKEQIQKKKVFLEGLQYYKTTLKNQINQSKLNLVDVKDYIEQSPSNQTNWIEDYKQEETKLLGAISEFKNLKVRLEQSQAQKHELEIKINQNQEKCKKTLPQQAKKLYQQVSEVSKMFNIKEFDALASGQFKSQKLEQIFNLIYPLKLKGLIEIKHINQFETEEIQITVQKGFWSSYEYAQRNKMSIEEKQFKFCIASILKEIDEQKKVIIAISVSRREDFTVEEIFSNLFLQQKVKQIYCNPRNEGQRNLNNKYSYVSWIGEVLASASSLINGNEFIDRIKNRIFHLSLVRYLTENISKKILPYFTPIFKHNEKGYQLISFPIFQSKKILFSKCEKTSFEDYKREAYIPNWVTKALSNYAILKRNVKFETQQQTESKKILEERQALNQFIESSHLQELEIPDFYSYYRFNLFVEKNELTGFFLVPSNYPNKRSIVRLIDYKRAGEGLSKIPSSHSSQLVLQNQDFETRNQVFTQQLSNLQTELNQKMDEIVNCKSDNNNPSKSHQRFKRRESFMLFYQINRLISLFIQKSLKNQL